MKPVTEIIARADAELSAGRPWRAKEILRGGISGRMEPAILERYGRLLDSLGERVEAGKYLFLSGARLPEYAEAIALFKARTAKLRESALASQFPSALRRLRFDELPATLQRDLRELGVAEKAFGRQPRRTRAEPTRVARVVDRLVIGLAIAVLGLFLVALALGIGVIGRWVWTYFR